jgi:hypothetical protein
MVRRAVTIQPDPGIPAAPESLEPPPDFGDLAALAQADEGWRWQVHRLKSADEIQKNPRGKPRVWVTTIHGAVDLEDFHARRGGGVYEFWGSADGQLQTRVTIELDGPPKIPVDPPPAAAPTSAPPPHSNGTDPALLLALDRIMLRLEQVGRAAAPPEKSSSITELVTALGSLDSMRQRNQPPTDSSTAKELFASMATALKTGIELGQGRDPLPAEEGGGAAMWLKVAETFVPLANRVLDRMSQARAVRPPGTPPPARAPAAVPEAVMVEPAAARAAATPAGEPDLPAARMMAAVDALARAITEQVDPADFANTLGDILTEDELGPIISAPADLVIDDIVARASGRYPVLEGDGARTYLRTVLSELRSALADNPSALP